jgi:hypothetical protein
MVGQVQPFQKLEVVVGGGGGANMRGTLLPSVTAPEVDLPVPASAVIAPSRGRGVRAVVNSVVERKISDSDFNLGDQVIGLFR